MASQELILSPQEKKLAEPLLKYFTPEHLQGKKEVIINKPGQIGYEAFDGSWTFIDDPMLTLDTLFQIMNLLADRTGQTFNLANPILSVKMPGGHRAQFIAGQQNAKNFSLCIRLNNERTFSLENFNMPPDEIAQLTHAVINQKTILISGGTGSGKTSFMNALIPYIPADERLVTIEDVPELKVGHENVCALLFSNFAKSGGMDRVAAVNELLNACLRMRPDRILLGEIRKENAFTFCSAINTGHQGSMATIHANDPNAAINAVINRVMLNGDTTESAMRILREQLESDIYGVVQLTRKKDGVYAYFRVLKPDEEDVTSPPPQAAPVQHTSQPHQPQPAQQQQPIQQPVPQPPAQQQAPHLPPRPPQPQATPSAPQPHVQQRPAGEVSSSAEAHPQPTGQYKPEE